MWSFVLPSYHLGLFTRYHTNVLRASRRSPPVPALCVCHWTTTYPSSVISRATLVVCGMQVSHLSAPSVKVPIKLLTVPIEINVGAAISHVILRGIARMRGALPPKPPPHPGPLPPPTSPIPRAPLPLLPLPLMPLPPPFLLLWTLLHPKRTLLFKCPLL